jgi:hypothetical protein
MVPIHKVFEKSTKHDLLLQLLGVRSISICATLFAYDAALVVNPVKEELKFIEAIHEMFGVTSSP